MDACTLLKCARNSVLPFMLPLIGDSIHPEEVNPKPDIALMVLAMTALWTAGSLTTPPAPTCNGPNAQHRLRKSKPAACQVMRD